jgi:putative FmdB family regulatory protein
MPIYEYQCGACGHKLEAIQKISDDPLTECPECGEAALHKLISAAGFRLKGGGWYETDFKSSSRKNVAETGSKSDASSNKAAGCGCGSKTSCGH